MSSFECAQYVERAYPDAMADWPDINRNAAVRARNAMLPAGGDITGEKSYCVDRTHDRFPADTPDRFTHALVYQFDTELAG